MNRPVVFLTHHKCASTWLIRYLAEFCALNAMKLSSSHLSEEPLDRSCDIFVWQNARYDFASRRIDDGIHFIRNPLDILVSAYYSHKFTHPVEGWPELKRQREILEGCSVSEGLYLTLAFIERDDFYNGAVGPLHALRHWMYADTRYDVLKMEDAVLDPGGRLGSILQTKFPNCVLPPSEEHTFSRIAGRQVGQINDRSHYRSGKADQWRDSLPEPLIVYIMKHYSGLLDRFYPHVFRP